MLISYRPGRSGTESKTSILFPARFSFLRQGQPEMPVIEVSWFSATDKVSSLERFSRPSRFTNLFLFMLREVSIE